MNVQFDDVSTQSFETQLQAALALRCKLQPKEVERITAYMHDSNFSFSQSALRLGYVSQEDVDNAIDGLQGMDGDEKENLVEAAIHKLAGDRQLVVHLADEVTPSAQLVLAHDPYSERSELIRALRTELLLRHEAREANIVSVVSSSPAEGRSQLAAELAIAYAQLGRRTLLVDADMRNPSQHRLFAADNQRGLADCLVRGENAYVHPVRGLPSMSLLTTGAVPSNPLELLSGGGFRRHLEDWKKNYEFIVIDTPPVTRCADALAIATLAGRVLLVVRAEHTRYTDTKETLRRLATTRAQILGAAMNHF